MKTQALKTRLTGQTGKTAIPVTPRGRALYTTDWFLNGHPVLRNHDNPHMTLDNGRSCF